MSDRLYELYEQELRFINEEASEFEGGFPKVAKRLRLTTGDPTQISEDPHVTRLIGSFALLTARLRLKLEDEFPEICEAMFANLYPQYLAPTPSCAIVQFEPDIAGAAVATGITVPRGALVESQEVRGQSCKYRTCFDLRIQPFKVRKSDHIKPPFVFKTESTWSNKVESAIQIEMVGCSDKLEWSKTNVDRLQFFLGGGTSCGNRLYEAIFRDALGVGIYSDAAREGKFLGPDSIRPVGFYETDSVFHNDARTLPAYRILWEFFAIPEKFRFAEIDVSSIWRDVAGNNLKIVIFLRRDSAILRKTMSSDAIQTGCTPVVNLFEQDAEPINLGETQTNYRVVPSYRSNYAFEVHTIQSVVASRSGDAKEVTFLPFYQPSHRLSTSDRDRYWFASRKTRNQGKETGDRGTEVFLTIVDLHSRPVPDDNWVLHVKTLCCNSDLANEVGVQTGLSYSNGQATVRFRTSPTQTRRPNDRKDWIWKLISHLSINHLMISSDSDGKLLRELLSLYASQEYGEGDEVRNAIDSIKSVSYSRATARLAGSEHGPGICRGINIVVDVDDDRMEAIGVYLFSSILDHFFSALASINSFTRLKVVAKNGAQLLYQGVPRSGTKALL
jgi:type VI secretion system protein ImpG